LDGLGNVFRVNSRFAFEIGDSSGDFQNAIMGACRKSLLGHGAFEQAFAVGLELAEGADVTRRHLRIGKYLAWRDPDETLQLSFAGANHSVANLM